MGMSMSVVGIKPADEKYKKMIVVWDACQKAGVAPPKEVTDFFGDEVPDPAGIQVDLIPYPKPWASGVSEYKTEYTDGFEVDLRKLDPDLKILRFYCSW
jgi:hypothetical protein